MAGRVAESGGEERRGEERNDERWEGWNSEGVCMASIYPLMFFLSRIWNFINCMTKIGVLLVG